MSSSVLLSDILTGSNRFNFNISFFLNEANSVSPINTTRNGDYIIFHHNTAEEADANRRYLRAVNGTPGDDPTQIKVPYWGLAQYIVEKLLNRMWKG